MKEDGYPEYARLNNGRTVEKANNIIFTNEHIVSHYPTLLMEFNCHINLEICASIKSVKHIYKYIYKGPDHATLEMGGVINKVKTYLDSRYISSVEAVWSIMEFSLHLEWPSIYCLPIHLLNKDMVVCDPTKNVQDVLDCAEAREICLTGWFKAIQQRSYLGGSWSS